MTLVPPTTPTLVEWVCWIGLLIAVVTDLRSMRIPNVLTVPLMGAGLALHTFGGTPMIALYGLVLAFGVHFALFALGVDMAGDAKLMMGVGACLGWAEMLEATLFSLVVFFPVGLILVAVRGRIANALAAGQWVVAKAQGQDAGERPQPIYLAKAPFIAIGVLIATLVELV